MTTPALRRTMLSMPSDRRWLTRAEMPGATGMALTLLCVGSAVLAERRRVTTEDGHRGDAYQYRLTEEGLVARSVAKLEHPEDAYLQVIDDAQLSRTAAIIGEQSAAGRMISELARRRAGGEDVRAFICRDGNSIVVGPPLD